MLRERACPDPELLIMYLYPAEINGAVGRDADLNLKCLGFESRVRQGFFHWNLSILLVDNWKTVRFQTSLDL
jgi:hypothetical protein